MNRRLIKRTVSFILHNLMNQKEGILYAVGCQAYILATREDDTFADDAPGDVRGGGLPTEGAK